MRLEMADFRGVSLQQRVLAKLMLLEYFRPESFRRLADLQGAQEGRPQQLLLMEREARGETEQPVAEEEAEATDDGVGTAARRGEKPQAKRGKSQSKGEAKPPAAAQRPELESEFRTWLNQNWTNEWLRLDPPLADMDLRPYFFFSRDTLLGPLWGETQRMSPLAQEVLEDLLKESQAVRDNALRKASDLSMADAVAVFEGLSQRAQQEEEYGPDNLPFQRLFDWTGARKELIGELVTLLRRLPENAISSVVVLKLLSVSQGHETEGAAYELIGKWARGTNRLLAEAAKGRLERRQK